MSIVGKRVGNYVIADLIGEGGMGAVYRAEHPEIGRKVAVKILDPRLSDHPEVCKRFLAEARAIARIEHQNIIDIYDFGRTIDGQLYYVMELLKGVELWSIMEQRGPMMPQEIRPYVEQICEGLQAAHDHKVVHRDLKPENIFILDAKRLCIKIIDFGIAKVNDPGFEGPKLTAKGVVMGSPMTMSPEQAAGMHEKIGPQTDIYSLGVTFYWMLAGQPPFDEPTPAVVLAKHITDQPPPLRGFNDGVPEEVAELIHRCLAKEPEDRPQTASEILQEFNQAVRRLSQPFAIPSGEELVAQVAAAPPEKKKAQKPREGGPPSIAMADTMPPEEAAKRQSARLPAPGGKRPTLPTPDGKKTKPETKPDGGEDKPVQSQVPTSEMPYSLESPSGEPLSDLLGAMAGSGVVAAVDEEPLSDGFEPETQGEAGDGFEPEPPAESSEPPPLQIPLPPRESDPDEPRALQIPLPKPAPELKPVVAPPAEMPPPPEEAEQEAAPALETLLPPSEVPTRLERPIPPMAPPPSTLGVPSPKPDPSEVPPPPGYQPPQGEDGDAFGLEPETESAAFGLEPESGAEPDAPFGLEMPEEPEPVYAEEAEDPAAPFALEMPEETEPVYAAEAEEEPVPDGPVIMPEEEPPLPPLPPSSSKRMFMRMPIVAGAAAIVVAVVGLVVMMLMLSKDPEDKGKGEAKVPAGDPVVLTVLPGASVEQRQGQVAKTLGIAPDAPLEQFEKSADKSPAVRLLVGELTLAAGRPAEAVVHFKAVLSAKAANAPAQFRLAEALQEGARYNAALEAYRKVLELDSNLDAHTRTKMGQIYGLQKRASLELGEYQAAIGANPDYAPALVALGYAYARLRRYDEAITELDRAAKLDPTNADAFYYRGFVVFNLGKVDEAITSFQQALKLRPSAEAHYYLGQAHLQQGDKEKARSAFKDALKLNPDYEPALLALKKL